MPPIDESCVLIPAATLEDFPSDLSDYDARSLLAAWTVLWHPSLLARTGQLPLWQRADAPPDPNPGQLLTLPTAATAKLPSDYVARVESTEHCYLIRGGSRAELLDQIRSLGDQPAAWQWLDPPPLSTSVRQVAVADFYAAGYALLQIQVMTRRLRYTSNLDELHLQRRMVDAATALLEGNAEESAAALHDVFDLLAQERDHYFSSSDPHLIDLTLSTAATVPELLAEISAFDRPSSSEDDRESVLPTPRNYLIDQDVCRALQQSTDRQVDDLRELVTSHQLGWAGGGPSAETCLDLLTLDQADRCVNEATTICESTLGLPPKVFARFSGGWPGDMNASLVRLGYCGVIPFDFANGTGYTDEAKVILESGGAKLDGLTAKPIDAASDAAFLTLGTRLGESIDSGEIATALLAHWPGQSCDSFADFRRAATWSLCLGRFWKLDAYFSEGEHPYHHGSAAAPSKSSAEWLESLCDRGIANPISSAAGEFRTVVVAEQSELISGLAALLGQPGNADCDPLDAFAKAIQGDLANDPSSAAILIVNPASVGHRAAAETQVKISTEPAHIYACSDRDSSRDVTVDVPGGGFVILPNEQSSVVPRQSITRAIRARLAGRSETRQIAEVVRGDRSIRLENEFLEAVISHASGGIAGVYSGSVRGNRFSMKLVQQHADSIEPTSESVMRCDQLQIISSTPAIGQVGSSGVILDQTDGKVLAEYSLEFTLHRGSRLLRVRGHIKPRRGVAGNPWQNYIAARAAVAGEAAIYRPLVRDKVHRTTSRRMIAPLGVVIDEAERQTLVASDGIAAHRRVADRFLDTLLLVAHETEYSFTVSYGFDVSAPVAAARAAISPPPQRQMQVSKAVPPLGWIVHVSPNSVLVNRLQVGSRDDGREAAIVRLVQTRSQPVTATVRFPHDIAAAIRLTAVVGGSLDQPLPDSNRQRLAAEGDCVTVPMAAHAVVDVLVVFDSAAARESAAALEPDTS